MRPRSSRPGTKECRSHASKGDGRRKTMKAIVYHDYGSPDVLRCEEVDKPTAGDDDVLIAVRAASVNPRDWHFMRGAPYMIRLMPGLRKPKDDAPGSRSGRPGRSDRPEREAIQAGRRGIRRPPRAPWPNTCVYRSFFGAQAGQPHVRAGGCHAHRGVDRAAGASQRGPDSAGPESPDQRCGGRSGDVRRADRQVIRRERDRRMQHEECGPGPIDRSRPCHRLHPRRFHLWRSAVTTSSSIV